MHIHTEMVVIGGLQKMFDLNGKRWTNSSTFIDDFVQRALSSSQLLRPAATFFKQSVNGTTQAIEPDIQQDG